MLALAVVAMAAIPVVAIGMAVSRPHQGGPLMPPTGVQVDAKLPAGGRGTWGVVLVAPSGDKPAILESVKPATEPVGLEIIDISAQEIVGSAIGTSREYPPPGELIPVDGAVVAPAATGPRSQLIIGVQYPGPGTGAIHGLIVRYSVGDEHYELLLDVAYSVTPLDESPEPPAERRHVVEIVGHEAGNSLDVVALVLDRPIQGQPRAPSRLAGLTPGKRLATWTWTLSARGLQGCVVRSIELVVAPPADCAPSPAADFEVDPTTMVCARTAIEGEGACFGDSGAPVMGSGGELVAIVSRGFNCGHSEILARADVGALGSLFR